MGTDEQDLAVKRDCICNGTDGKHSAACNEAFKAKLDETVKHIRSLFYRGGDGNIGP